MNRHLLLMTGLLLGFAGRPVEAQEIDRRRADLARMRGAEQATHWLVVVGDLANPGNRRFQMESWPVIDSLFVRPGKLRVAWINLPSDSSRASMVAAEIAACSGTGMKFWPLQAAFLREQPRWAGLKDPTEFLLDLSSRSGGAIATYGECVTKHQMQSFLREDIIRARQAGIREAPGFLLDNKILTGVKGPADFVAAIERALAVKK